MVARFHLNGTGQSLWRRNAAIGKPSLLAQSALHAVFFDANAKQLYYIYAGNLHLRNLQTGGDYVIAISVKDADYLR
jgi:hypothetical protein